MRFRPFPILALPVLCAACAQRDVAPLRDMPCPEPRPQVCTMIYEPVCARHLDGVARSHASACNACADDSVVSYRDGSCEEESSP